MTKRQKRLCAAALGILAALSLTACAQAGKPEQKAEFDYDEYLESVVRDENSYILTDETATVVKWMPEQLKYADPVEMPVIKQETDPPIPPSSGDICQSGNIEGHFEGMVVTANYPYQTLVEVKCVHCPEGSDVVSIYKRRFWDVCDACALGREGEYTTDLVRITACRGHDGKQEDDDRIDASVQQTAVDGTDAQETAQDMDFAALQAKYPNVVFVFEGKSAPDANDPNNYMPSGLTRKSTKKNLPYVTLDTLPQTVETTESCPSCPSGVLNKRLVTENAPYREDLETVCCHLDYNTDLAYAYKRAYHAVCDSCGETAYTEEAADLLQMRICGGVSYDEDGWIYIRTGKTDKRSASAKYAKTE